MSGPDVVEGRPHLGLRPPAQRHPGQPGHRELDGGVLAGLKAVRHGTLAELIRFILTLPEGERANYEIEKSGDHRLAMGEILKLAKRPDFPAA